MSFQYENQKKAPIVDKMKGTLVGGVPNYYNLPIHKDNEDLSYIAPVLSSTSASNYRIVPKQAKKGDACAWEQEGLALQVQHLWGGITCITCITCMYLYHLYYLIYWKSKKKHQSLTHSVSDNLKSRDASASKNSNKPITNLSTNCLRFVLVFPFSRKIWKKRVWKIGEKLSLSDSTVQYKAFNMIISSCAGARTSVWPSDAPCLGETRPCHSSSRLSVSTAINYHSTRLS